MYWLAKVFMRLSLLGVMLMLIGCSTYSSNLHIGNSMDYTSLAEQRRASETIQIFNESPSNAILIGSVDAARCHRDTSHISPNKEILILDLKIAAYALGANAISKIEIDQQSGLSDNCWYVLNGKAQALKIKP